MTHRNQFSALDMLEQAAGLPTPEGYAVITKEFARFLREELERLYEIEDTAAAVIAAIEAGEPSDINQARRLRRLCHTGE